MSLARPTTLLALAVVLAVPAASRAQEKGKTNLQVLVAQVSTKGTQVAPELKGMEADLKRTRLPFTNFKLLSKTALVLKLNETGQVSLPNKGVAKLTPLKVEGAVTKVKLESPKVRKMILDMTPGGEIYIGAGPSGDDEIYLAIKR